MEPINQKQLPNFVLVIDAKHLKKAPAHFHPSLNKSCSEQSVYRLRIMPPHGSLFSN